MFGRVHERVVPSVPTSGRPGGPKGTEPVEEERHRLLAPALQEQPCPLVERAQRLPELKTLLGRDARLFLGRRLRRLKVCRLSDIRCSQHSSKPATRVVGQM